MPAPRRFTKGEEVVTTICISEAAGIPVAVAYKRCVRWELNPDMDLDDLCKPVLTKKQVGSISPRTSRVYKKGGEIATINCVVSALGCAAATANDRCVKWEAIPELDFDWLFRPIEERYRRDSVTPNRKEVEQKIKAYDDSFEDYRKQLRKHYGLPEKTTTK